MASRAAAPGRRPAPAAVILASVVQSQAPGPGLRASGRPRLPLHQPVRLGAELEYLAEATQPAGLARSSRFRARCERLLGDDGAARRVLLTTSCTAALELSALLLRLGPGDEVIVPAYAFVSTAAAFLLHGARPVFVDVRPDTLNLDEGRLEAAITPRTRAVVALHYAGVACEMDAIGAIARAHGLLVIEDNAHGPFGAYRGRPLGSLGTVAALSFHSTKNFTSGEGGALVVNQASLHERAQVLYDKGTDRGRFMRGQVAAYSWVDVGSSFQPSELVAAHLCAQLEQRERVRSHRRALWSAYAAGLLDWADRIGARLPVVPGHCESADHIFHLLLPDHRSREQLIHHLRGAGIEAACHYQPLHLSEVGRGLGGAEGDCPVTEDVCRRLLRLPMGMAMDLADVEEVVAVTRAWRPGCAVVPGRATEREAQSSSVRPAARSASTTSRTDWARAAGTTRTASPVSTTTMSSAPTTATSRPPRASTRQPRDPTAMPSPVTALVAADRGGPASSRAARRSDQEPRSDQGNAARTTVRS